MLDYETTKTFSSNVNREHAKHRMHSKEPRDKFSGIMVVIAESSPRLI